MLNRKLNCNSNRTCETGKTYPNSGTFFLMPVYNNQYDPRFVNSRTNVINKTNGVENLNTNRINGENCDPRFPDTKQQRLTMRNKPTPYRVPYNHYRKTYNCRNNNNCIPNEKIIKVVDNSSCQLVNGVLEPLCPKVNYSKTRLTNKFGFRNKNDGGNYTNYLEKSGKLYTGSINDGSKQ